MQKYTGIALGAGALPIAAATAPQTLPAMGRAAGAVARGTRAAANAAKPHVKSARDFVARNREDVKDAIQGIAPGPPPQSIGGAIGAGAAKAADYISEGVDDLKDYLGRKTKK